VKEFAVPTTDLAASERWLESQSRSRRRRFAAARQAARRRFGRRSVAGLLCVMALGSGAALASQTADVQRKLGVAADGVNGPQTIRAVKRFQRAHGLLVDGIVGPQTLGALGLTVKRATASSGTSAILERIAQCESGGDPTAVSSNGMYRGKYQFSRSTWAAMGGKGDPAAAPEAEQDRRAAALYAKSGPAPWPVCGR
jgi:peptidoglycan hydrolase-like protein with peptidoglycan-binding domain